jgi:hypothetical protein
MIILSSFGRDINGNSIVRFKIKNINTDSAISLNNRRIKSNKEYYGYSLQTNGNLPFTHNIKISGVKVIELSNNDRAKIANEISDFLQLHGSDKQKYLLSIS